MAKPIITTNNVGCRDVVDDGINGYLSTYTLIIFNLDTAEQTFKNEYCSIREVKK